MTATVLSLHRITVPAGLAGGQPGKPGLNLVQRSDGSVKQLTGNDKVEMASGDIFIMHTPGGGGFGR
ncbi:MAG: hydantoinase B/oxoprolinase family protein [Hoeflea sp.]|nr:hydantoinase B/oxoprolinase family protein [Hoeflea sp.]MBV1782880.1 hydantoinase B/oxoprolinase family protein [Hoeflea sp.]